MTQWFMIYHWRYGAWCSICWRAAYKIPCPWTPRVISAAAPGERWPILQACIYSRLSCCWGHPSSLQPRPNKLLCSGCFSVHFLWSLMRCQEMAWFVYSILQLIRFLYIHREIDLLSRHNNLCPTCIAMGTYPITVELEAACGLLYSSNTNCHPYIVCPFTISHNASFYFN